MTFFFQYGRSLRVDMQVLELVMEVDLNGDGTIDFQEFLQMMKKKSSEADQMEVWAIKHGRRGGGDRGIEIEVFFLKSKKQLLFHVMSHSKINRGFIGSDG